MALGMWLTIFICLTIFKVGFSQHRNVDIRARVGGSVEMSCSFPSYDRGSISWRKNHELIAVRGYVMTNNPRLRMDNERTVIIHPIAYEDEATYSCSNEDASLEQRFFVRLTDGHQQPQPLTHPGQFSAQSCQQVEQYITRHTQELTRHIQRLETQVEGIKNQQDRLEHYLKRLTDDRREIPTRAFPRTTPRPTAPTRPMYTYAPHTTRTRRPIPQTHLANYGEARSAYVNGRVVREYIWMIRDFENELYRSDMDGEHLLKTYFLTNIPGYNMTVRLYPNRKRLDYIAIYGGIAPGIHDRIISWPFRQDFELAIVSHSSSESDVVRSIRPFESNCPVEAFNQKWKDTGDSCGYNQFLSLSEFRRKKYAYLNNGYLYVRIRVQD